MQTPAWRAAIVQPPWIASGERPASASSVSAPSASAKPAPIAICGGTSQPHAARREQRQRGQAAADQDRAGTPPAPGRAPRGTSR